MNIILEKGYLQSDYAQQTFNHLLDSVKRFDNWKNQDNVKSLSPIQTEHYNNNRAISGFIAEMAMFKLLTNENIKFQHCLIEDFPNGTQRDTDFILLDSGMKIDVKAYFPTFKQYYLQKTQYDAFSFATFLLPQDDIYYHKGLHLLKNIEDVISREIDVTIHGVISKKTLIAKPSPQMYRWKITGMNSFLWNHKNKFGDPVNNL